MSKQEHCLAPTCSAGRRIDRHQIPCVISSHRDLQGFIRYFTGSRSTTIPVTAAENKKPAACAKGGGSVPPEAEGDVMVLARFLMQILSRRSCATAVTTRIDHQHPPQLPAEGLLQGPSPLHQAWEGQS